MDFSFNLRLCLIFLVMTSELLRPVESICQSYREDNGGPYHIYCEYSLDNFIEEVLRYRLGQQFCIDYNCEIKEYQYNIIFFLNLELYKINNFDGWSDNWSLNGKVHTISITQTNMTEIPNKIYDFPRTVKIKIVQNQIQEISLNKFINLSNLMSLNVSHNAIAVLKDAAPSGYNTNVNIIDISYNLMENLTSHCFQQFSNLLHLNLSHNLINNINILTFEGISLLETLDLSYNRLMEIDNNFARLVNLRKLELNHNNLTLITNINFIAIEKLEYLDLSSNQIKYIKNNSFSTLHELKKINLRNNRIQNISKSLFHTNHKLTDLFLNENDIFKIDSKAFEMNHICMFNISHNSFSGAIEKHTFKGILTDTLDLSGHKIDFLKDEAFFGIYNLRVLNLSSNFLTNIAETSFKSLQYLNELDLSNNNLSSIDFDTSDLKNLNKLVAKNNSINHLAKTALGNLTFLIKLDLSHNNICELKSQLFAGLDKLEFVDLSYNFLITYLGSTKLQSFEVIPQTQVTNTVVHSYHDGAFSGLTHLKTLNSSHGQLSLIEFEAFKDTGAIIIMDLSFNLLETFTVNSSSIASVEELYLNNNKIINLGSEVLHLATRIRFLDLSHNIAMNIEVKVLESLPFLTQVFLNHNEKHISFENSHNITIKQLDLSFADIGNINNLFVFKVKNIEYLNLKSNKIDFLDKFSFQSMPTLTLLDLSCNLISFIQPGSFRYTNNIKYLNLHANKLPSLQFGVFDGLRVLETLNLSNNVLSEFNINWLHSAPLVTTISLDDNNISDIKFKDFEGTHLKKMTVGGNLIPCHKFLLDHLEYHFTVGADTLDYHSENVDGIKCKSDSVIYNFTRANATDVDSVALYEAISSTNKLQNETIMMINNTVAHLTKTLEKILTNDSLILNENTHNYYKKIIDDVKTMLPSMKNEEQRLENKNDTVANNDIVKNLLYVISVSLFILTIISVYQLICKLTNNQTNCNFFNNNRIHSSTQPMVGVIELQDA